MFFRFFHVLIFRVNSGVKEQKKKRSLILTKNYVYHTPYLSKHTPFDYVFCCTSSSLFNRVYSIITNKDDLHKENTRIKQALEENEYREIIINKIFRRITNNHSLHQSQQLTQATDIPEEEIRISINLRYVEGNSEKLHCILRSHKIRSTFYTEITLRKLLCKPKD